LSDIHSEYKLDVGKIVCTVTDNAANFKKAFTEYMAPDPDGDEESGDEDDINVADVNIILQEGNQALADDLDENEGYIHLPTHHKCVSHTLNLIATTDADKALSSPAYSRIYHGSMGKCQAVWNSVHHSSKASDAVAEIIPGKKRSFHVQHAGIRSTMLLRDCWNLKTTLDPFVTHCKS